MSTESIPTINVLFKEAKRKFAELDAYSSSTREAHEHQNALCTLHKEFSMIQSMVERLDFFSDNESFEEISTSYIPFLALDYYIASVSMRLEFGELNRAVDDDARRQYKLKCLHEARRRFLQFLETLAFFGSVLNSEDVQLLKLLKDGSSSDVNLSTVMKNPYERRKAKIKNFKRRKELEDKLRYLDQSFTKRGSDVEVIKREYFIDEIRLLVLNTLDNIFSIDMEMGMLEKMPPHDQTNYTPSMHSKKDQALRVEEVPGKKRIDDLIGPGGKILQPFTITKTKADIRNAVFGYSHTLPSMSVDEYLEYELMHGKLLNATNTKEEQDEHSENSDEELYARNWDDWKDDHPKGSGNMKANIG
ncbi:Immunoglobulin (CD79A) binding protein 1 [Candidozyma auris]|uniref:Type 2A phosphatase-associated protein 42 n=1 Tax=Candidozyma auris TaxID=498019 RepID=A0A8F2W2X8_CANAR|nr:hypothetical protein QG37_01463 [[Candida] auris]QWW24699.1 hypothetical protein CA7LBN_003556 [[Candida] auris]